VNDRYYPEDFIHNTRFDEPEVEYHFCSENRAFYETYLWTGQVLALLAAWQEQVRQEAVFTAKGTRRRAPSTSSGVHLGLLLSTFEEARGGPACFGPEPRDQEVQRTAHGSGKVEMLGVRKGVQSDTTQAHPPTWDEWGNDWDDC
jgi:hypothetical protein